MFELDPTLTARTSNTFGLDCAWTPEQLFLNGQELDNQALILKALVNLIRKKPEHLLTHVWRVFFCYRGKLAEPLYAALVDLLITLDGRGLALSARLIEGSRSLLSHEAYQGLTEHQAQPQNLPGNRYCLFTKGLIGNTQLFASQPKPEHTHSVLQLAHDFIEYSQLDEAMDTLELGILETPHDPDLQRLLLEVFVSTQNRIRCQQFHQQLLDAGIVPIADWQAILTRLSV